MLYHRPVYSSTFHLEEPFSVGHFPGSLIGKSRAKATVDRRAAVVTVSCTMMKLVVVCQVRKSLKFIALRHMVKWQLDKLSRSSCRWIFRIQNNYFKSDTNRVKFEKINRWYLALRDFSFTCMTTPHKSSFFINHFFYPCCERLYNNKYELWEFVMVYPQKKTGDQIIYGRYFSKTQLF